MSAAFRIRPLRGLDEFRDCVRLQEETWGPGFSERVPVAILMAAQRIGGVAAGAFGEDGRLAGFVFGISGFEADRRIHWSDMLAVRAEHREHGLGTRLKLYQRDELLRLGVSTVYWTFDPLESKNAYFNITRLGVVSAEYRVDYYGETDSPVHRGIGTDRLVARWDIDGERVRRRVDDGARPASSDDFRDAPFINPVAAAAAGLVSAHPDLAMDAPRLRLTVPSNIQAIKAADLDLAGDWRRKTRAAFQSYFARGYAAVEFLRADDRGDYILERADIAGRDGT